MILVKAITKGLEKSAKTFWKITKIIVPVYFLIKVLEYTNLLVKISSLFAPVMKVFGLPGEAALVLILGMFLNLYGGIGALVSIVLTTKQITILAMMLLFCHSLPIETSIIKGIGIPVYKQVILRATTSIIAGLLLNLIWR